MAKGYQPKKKRQINLDKFLPIVAIIVTLAFGTSVFIATGDAARVIAYLFK